MFRIGPLQRLYAFGAAWMGVMLMPVYVPFLATRGVSASQVFDLQSIYAWAMLAFEIPTGIICDTLGRKWTLLIASVLNMLGFAGFAAVHGFAAYAAIQIVLASGFSLVSGADVALLYDILDEVGADRDSRHQALGKLTMAKTFGEAGFGLLGGVIAAWSFRAVGIATAAETILPLLIALTLPWGSRRRRGPSLGEVSSATKTLFQRPGVSLVFANLAVWGIATFIGVWLVQPYWQAQDIDLRWFGLLWGGTLATAGLVGRAAHRLTMLAGRRWVFLALTLAPIAAYAGMAAFSGPIGVASGYLLYASRGLTAVSLTEALNHQIPSGLRATFNSLNSAAFRLIFAIVGPLVGLALHHYGLNRTLWMVSAGLFVIFLVLGLRLVRRAPEM